MYNYLTKAHHTLTKQKIFEVIYRKEQNNKVVDQEGFIKQLQKRVLVITDQNVVLRIKIVSKEALLHVHQ